MQQNGTDLKPVQLATVEKLMTGSSVTDAAKAANVSRGTIHRWLSEDFKFQAELSRRRRDLQMVVDSSLLAIAHRATEVVAAAVESGDVTASIRVLKGIGALSGNAPRIGAEDPKTLREKANYRRFQDLMSSIGSRGGDDYCALDQKAGAKRSARPYDSGFRGSNGPASP